MKINWFCFLLFEKIDIVYYINCILIDLYKCVDVVFWMDKENWSLELVRMVEVCFYYLDLLFINEIK